jgi:hypothetical protein
MIILPEDLYSFHYCPYLYFNKTKKSIYNYQRTFLEENIVKAIRLSEESCLLKGSEVNTQKIIRKWDSFWWEEATINSISLKEADELSIIAANFFSQYCKFDISGYMFPTIGSNLLVQKELFSDMYLNCYIDIYKIDLLQKEKNSIIIKFGNQKLTKRQVVSSIETKSIVYSLFEDQENIRFIYVFLKEKNKIDMISAFFRKEDILQIEKSLEYILSGIKHNIQTVNDYNCEECKQCKAFKY